MRSDLWPYMVLCSLILLVLKVLKSKENRPPGPPSLPILGHLHLLKEPVHRTLHELSQKYGHVMFLQFGVRRVLVVSSPEAAEECFTKNDQVFADRPDMLAGKLINYNSTTIGFAPYGAHWRNLRRITAVEMFSTSRLAMLTPVREEEVRLMLQQVHEICRDFDPARVELRPLLVDLTYNVLMRMITGKRFYGKKANVLDDERRLFQAIMKEASELHGNANLGDYFPLFWWVDVQGVQKRMSEFHKKLDRFIQKLVDDHREQPDRVQNTLIDVMLSLQETDPESHSDETIKGLVLAMIGAGTETTSTALEWSMSLLLNHPNVIQKAYDEIQACCGQEQRLLSELDLPKLTYLSCIVDESLRLFPPTPLLLPHQSSDNCNVCGYNIPKGTMLLVNLWTIQRNPNVWEDSTLFKPDRFEGGATDEGFKFIPFGAGRRACPGVSLGRRVVMAALGGLIQCFEWGRVRGEEVDMAEGTGLTMPKLKSLEGMCRPRSNIEDLLLS